MQKLIYLNALIVMLVFGLTICDVGTKAQTTINVPADYALIQDAIDVASAGDIINIAAGTYTENIVVDKKLTIQGAGSGTTILDASSGSIGILITAGGSSATDRLTIKEMTIQNASLDGIRTYIYGGFNLDFVTLENLVVTLNGAKGMEIHNGTIVSDLLITNCEFINNTHQGLRTASNVIVDGMEITDSKFNGNWYGIYLQGTLAGVTLENTIINENTIYGLYASETGPITNFSIKSCQINANTAGYGIVFFTTAAAGIDGINIIRTTIDNSGRGFWIGADLISNFLMEETFVINNVRTSTTSTFEGVTFAYGVLTNVLVTNSNISGNNARGLANYATGIVLATCNWWGDASGPSGEGPGTGDAVTTNVNFLPWLIDGTDNELTTGFQPVPNSCFGGAECGKKNDKVSVCHNGHTICISPNALPAHLAHGDVVGPCSLGKETVEVPQTPEAFSLNQNYPNPFNPNTKISFQIPVKSFVELSIFNILGEKVATLVSETKEAGYYEVEWNSNNLVSGLYVYSIKAGNYSENKKMLLMK